MAANSVWAVKGLGQQEAVKRHGRPKAIVSHRLRSYGVALGGLGGTECLEVSHHLNNMAENSH